MSRKFILRLKTSEELPPIDGIEGCNVTLEKRNSRIGMTANEIIWNVVISFASGIPSGILASWLYEKLNNNKSTRIFNENDDLIISIKELQDEIENFRKNSN